MELDKKKLASLPPEERLRKLRELEKQRQQELKEAERLIKDSIEELQSESDNRSGEEPPEIPRNSEISKLLESQLEETLQQEKESDLSDTTRDRQQEYVIQRYDELREMRATGQAYDNPERAFDIYRQIMHAAKYQSGNETISKIAMGSSRLMDEVLGEEKGKVKYFP